MHCPPVMVRNWLPNLPRRGAFHMIQLYKSNNAHIVDWSRPTGPTETSRIIQVTSNWNDPYLKNLKDTPMTSNDNITFRSPSCLLQPKTASNPLLSAEHPLASNQERQSERIASTEKVVMTWPWGPPWCFANKLINYHEAVTLIVMGVSWVGTQLDTFMRSKLFRQESCAVQAQHAVLFQDPHPILHGLLLRL